LTRFKLKSGIKFTPEGDKYVVLDPDTQSTFRVGEVEYQLLRQFEETTNIEEACYKLRTQSHYDISYEKLYGFINHALSLSLLQSVSDSLWNRFSPSRAYTYRIKLFNPDRAIDLLISKSKFLFNRYGVLLMFAMLISAAIILINNISDIWVFRSFAFPPYSLLMVPLVLLISIGHEMAHGIAGKWNGFEASEMGFHLHYFMPSFYCKIMRPSDATRKSILMVLLAGSLFDLLLISVLLPIWLFSSGLLVRELVAVGVSMLLAKICLIQLNPLWPYSDGYQIVGVLFFTKRGKDVE
jgi:hypothetical protein